MSEVAAARKRGEPPELGGGGDSGPESSGSEAGDWWIESLEDMEDEDVRQSKKWVGLCLFGCCSWGGWWLGGWVVNEVW